MAGHYYYQIFKGLLQIIRLTPRHEHNTLYPNVLTSGSGGLMNLHLFNDSFKSVGESFTTLPSPPQLLHDAPAFLKPASTQQPTYPPLDTPGPSQLPPPNGISTSRSYSPTMGIVIPISPNPRAYAQHPTYIIPKHQFSISTLLVRNLQWTQ
ncbi:hypothetical protein EDD22DRAFT_1031598 [Suillus occidentalis]|nr:hypothetical protein EDD22DRAFT_1031598 [Suillus occidentalis]